MDAFFVAVLPAISTISWRSFSSFGVFPPATPFNAAAHTDIAFITLSACVVVGLVMFLWLNCSVYVSRSALVAFMWHTCVL